ncbi:MAG: 4Fe-4S binding protein [Peptoniphilus sp.]|uniref:4Fe-4S binding protein n=1 Tax=Peptoniphilus sp. TaxID=1971214 RepID=UPI002A75780D|nr:4Fe-4S binding protein [Peptoniphilus sp.]MDY2987242.1 4Fe-4S binding protein [Peptoniphilus sp.]
MVNKIKEKNYFSKIRTNRGTVQGLATFITNIHLPNFFKGTIYTGKAKQVCVPGLNCYSCPGATGACPIGSFQAVVGSAKYKFSYYVTGLLILFGVAVGRLICGFLCPFGLFQDLLHKIPSKKLSTEKLKFLRYIKYIMLIAAVWLLGVFITDKIGISAPYFCKYVCPQGILEGGIPLSIANTSVRATLGKLFAWKSMILIITLILSILMYRPFCKWICPLGAFYSLFNKISLYQYSVDESLCINCGKCKRTCKMDVDMSKNQTALECIRCGKCVDVCPTGAISTSLSRCVSCSKNKKVREI